MARYNIPTEVQTELKMGKHFMLFDVIILASLGSIAWLTKGFVYEPLQYIYLIYAILVGFWVTRKPSSNPGKRNYQVMLIALRFNRTVYHSIDIDALEDDEA
ncbi:hypothetical protein HCJ39_07095 [Listeria rocourtiae]|uniref:DUF5592 family protein n=1 Tax=Listeria rocourtiae TaxID=647910 RepID=UPI0016237C4E|nr:DUF5592 family protein [Listeria rocourtiae]MBC1604476.1 hypothetical protein [Listeria rocourtiae]